MANCPFWSNGNKKISCYEECPMSKTNTSEDCVFSVFLTGISGEREKFRETKFSSSAMEIGFKDIEEDSVENFRYLKTY